MSEIALSTAEPQAYAGKIHIHTTYVVVQDFFSDEEEVYIKMALVDKTAVVYVANNFIGLEVV